MTVKELGKVAPRPSPDRPAQLSAPVARIELDRFCVACGYNLRTLTVHRDAHTQIAVVRCPECGRFQSANETSMALHPWLDRFVSVLLATWMLTLMAAFVMLGMADGAISYGTLDELTIHGGYETRQSGNTTTYTWRGSFGPLEVRPEPPEYKLFLASILTCSFLTAFVCGALAVVVFPHWRRIAYAALVVSIPVLAGVCVAVVWSYEAPHLFNWGLRYMMGHLGAQVLGGMIGVAFGRPLARGMVCILLPSSVRPRLSFLWLADNKPFPKPQR
jgi:hypothetical protein